MKMSQVFAAEFAKSWLSSWNDRDLDGILSNYADDFEMISPHIVAITGRSSGVLRGKAATKGYWTTALLKCPDLYFELRQVLIGVKSLAIHYRGIQGLAVETLIFNNEGKVIKAITHYE